MIGSLRALAGDALLAVGELVRGGSPNLEPDFDDTIQRHTQAAGWSTPFHAGGAMESDGPSLSWPAAEIPKIEVRSALDELSDSRLLGIAATVIEGWTPILLVTMRDATDVDLLVEALRDRSAQFAAIERDADEPWLSREHLHAHLTRSAQSASE